MTIQIHYPNKRTAVDILAATPKPTLRSIRGAGAKNRLIQGDNLPVMRGSVSIQVVEDRSPLRCSSISRL